MEFECSVCKHIFKRDMRTKIARSFMFKWGYKSYCETTGRNTFSKPKRK